MEDKLLKKSMKYIELVNDKDFKLVVNFISKKWNSSFDKTVKIDIGERKVEVDTFKLALQNYHWPYKIKESLPTGFEYCGSSYESSAKILNLASKMLRIEKNIQGATIVLEWGGVVNKNIKRINSLTFTDFKNEMNKAKSHWEGFCKDEIELESGKIDFHINSGFSKIYSLMLSDFIIYDSRTAAALSAIIYEVIRDRPKEWTLKVPAPRGDMKKRVLPEFGKVNTKKQYWESNIIANIIVKEVCIQLNNKSENVSMRQVEAALFMLGADIRKLKGINKKK
jgi:hypothetical protein